VNKGRDPIRYVNEKKAQGSWHRAQGGVFFEKIASPEP
jgi:hypothetical protein